MNFPNRINEVASVIGLVSELRSVEVKPNGHYTDIRTHVFSFPDQHAGLLVTKPSIMRTVERVMLEMTLHDSAAPVARG